MSENRILDAAASDEVGYRDPQVCPPPGGVKLLLLTEGGVAVIGTWADGAGFVAWSYLPKRAVRGAPQPSAEPTVPAASVNWLLTQCDEYQRRAHEAERLISRMRGQWIHSVHAGECLALLASIGQPQPNAPEAKDGGR
jgi:hypothetical protein